MEQPSDLGDSKNSLLAETTAMAGVLGSNFEAARSLT